MRFRTLALAVLTAATTACGRAPDVSAQQERAAPDGLGGTFSRVDGYGHTHYRTFLPGAYLYSATPAGGPDVFTLARARTGDPRTLGHYTLRGDSIFVDWGGGEPREAKSFARKGADVVLDGSTYSALPRYPAGHRLDGRYVTRSYSSMGVAGGGAVTWSGAASVTFRPDGTFEYGRSGSASSTTTGGTQATSGSDHSRGKYAIRGNTIVFTFADGTVQDALIHPWKGEESEKSPSSLNLNGNTYTRE